MTNNREIKNHEETKHVAAKMPIGTLSHRAQKLQESIGELTPRVKIAELKHPDFGCLVHQALEKQKWDDDLELPLLIYDPTDNCWISVLIDLIIPSRDNPSQPIVRVQGMDSRAGQDEFSDRHQAFFIQALGTLPHQKLNSFKIEFIYEARNRSLADQSCSLQWACYDLLKKLEDKDESEDKDEGEDKKMLKKIGLNPNPTSAELMTAMSRYISFAKQDVVDPQDDPWLQKLKRPETYLGELGRSFRQELHARIRQVHSSILDQQAVVEESKSISPALPKKVRQTGGHVRIAKLTSNPVFATAVEHQHQRENQQQHHQEHGQLYESQNRYEVTLEHEIDFGFEFDLEFSAPTSSFSPDQLITRDKFLLAPDNSSNWGNVGVRLLAFDPLSDGLHEYAAQINQKQNRVGDEKIAQILKNSFEVVLSNPDPRIREYDFYNCLWDLLICNNDHLEGGVRAVTYPALWHIFERANYFLGGVPQIEKSIGQFKTYPDGAGGTILHFEMSQPSDEFTETNVPQTEEKIQHPTFPDTEQHWWDTLVEQNNTNSYLGKLSEKELYEAFTRFTQAIKRMKVSLPVHCINILVKFNPNQAPFFDMPIALSIPNVLNSFLSMLSKVPHTHRDQQMDCAHELSWNREDVPHAAKYDGYRFFHPAMHLRAEEIDEKYETKVLEKKRDGLNYKITFDHLLKMAKHPPRDDREKNYAVTLFHRYLGRASHLHRNYDFYLGLVHQLQTSKLNTLQEPLLALLALCTSGERGHKVSDDAVKRFFRELKKKQDEHPDQLKKAISRLLEHIDQFPVKPNLSELTALIHFYAAYDQYIDELAQYNHEKKKEKEERRIEHQLRKPEDKETEFKRLKEFLCFPDMIDSIRLWHENPDRLDDQMFITLARGLFWRHANFSRKSVGKAVGIAAVSGNADVRLKDSHIPGFTLSGYKYESRHGTLVLLPEEATRLSTDWKSRMRQSSAMAKGLVQRMVDISYREAYGYRKFYQISAYLSSASYSHVAYKQPSIVDVYDVLSPLRDDPLFITCLSQHSSSGSSRPHYLFVQPEPATPFMLQPDKITEAMLAELSSFLNKEPPFTVEDFNSPDFAKRLKAATLKGQSSQVIDICYRFLITNACHTYHQKHPKSANFSTLWPLELESRFNKDIQDIVNRGKEYTALYTLFNRFKKKWPQFDGSMFLTIGLSVRLHGKVRRLSLSETITLLESIEHAAKDASYLEAENLIKKIFNDNYFQDSRVEDIGVVLMDDRLSLFKKMQRVDAVIEIISPEAKELKPQEVKKAAEINLKEGERDFSLDGVVTQLNQIKDLNRQKKPLSYSHREQLLDWMSYVSHVGKDGPLAGIDFVELADEKDAEIKADKNSYRTAVKDLTDGQLPILAAAYRKKIKEKSLPAAQDELLKKEYVALIRDAMYRATDEFPYVEQIEAALAYFLHDDSILYKVATGQGKGTILALVNALQSLGDTEHVLSATSSLDLANSDAEKFKGFYQKLGLSSGVTTKDDPTFKHDVCYITVSQLSLIAQRLLLVPEDVPTFALTIDEFDALYRSLELYNMAIPVDEKAAVDDTNRHQGVYLTMYDFASTKVAQSKNEKNWDDVNNLIEYINNPPENSPPIPGWVKKAIEKADDDRLDFWLEAAFNVKKMKFPEDYRIVFVDDEPIVMVKSSETQQDAPGALFRDAQHEVLLTVLNREIDRELRGGYESPLVPHISELTKPKKFKVRGERMSLSSRTAKVELDLVCKRAKRFIAATATTTDHERLQRDYRCQILEIPSHHTSNRKSLPHCVAWINSKWALNKKEYSDKASTDAHHAAILRRIRSCIQSGNPILIFCKSIKKLTALQEYLKQRLTPEEQYYFQTYDGNNPEMSYEEVRGKAGNPSMITLTTALMGRGTDIKVRPPTELFVLPTDIVSALNYEQMIGRTARQDQSGKCELLISEQELSDYREKYPKYERYNVHDPKELEKFITAVQQKMDDERSQQVLVHHRSGDVIEQYFQDYVETCGAFKKHLGADQWKFGQKKERERCHFQWRKFLKQLEHRWHELKVEMLNAEKNGVDPDLTPEERLDAQLKRWVDEFNPKWIAAKKEMYQTAECEGEVPFAEFFATTKVDLTPHLAPPKSIADSDIRPLDPDDLNPAKAYVDGVRKASPEAEINEEVLKQAFAQEMRFLHLKLFYRPVGKLIPSLLIKKCLNHLLEQLHSIYEQDTEVRLSQNRWLGLYERFMLAVKKYGNDNTKRMVVELLESHFKKYKKDSDYIQFLRLNILQKNREGYWGDKLNSIRAILSSSFEGTQYLKQRYESYCGLFKASDRKKEVKRLLEALKTKNLPSDVIAETNKGASNAIQDDIKYDAARSSFSLFGYRNTSGSEFQKMVRAMHDKAMLSLVNCNDKKRMDVALASDAQHINQVRATLLARAELKKTSYKWMREDAILKDSILENGEANLNKIIALDKKLQECIERFRFPRNNSERAFVHFMKDLQQRTCSYIAIAKHIAPENVSAPMIH